MAVSNVEKIFAIITMLISCGVFAYSINAIGNIINSYREEDL